MSLKLRLGVDGLGRLAASLFYAIVGVISFAVLPAASFPPHVAIIGILSLIAAYGLARGKIWTPWIVVALFFLAMTISAYTLYFAFWESVLVSLGLAIYAALSFALMLYALSMKKAPE